MHRYTTVQTLNEPAYQRTSVFFSKKNMKKLSPFEIFLYICRSNLKLLKLMNKLFVLFLGIVLLSSCQKTKQGMVNDFINAVNGYNVQSVGKLVSNDFVYIDNDTLSISDFISVLDSLKAHKVETTILRIEETDSVIKTVEQSRSIIDSLLGVKPNLIKEKTYRFIDDKLCSVTVDTTLNYVEHQEALNEKKNAFIFYLKDKYELENETDVTDELEKYLNEYVNLSPSDKKKCAIYGNLQGTYVSKDCAFYRKLIFRGKKTVTTVDAFFGMSFTSSFEVDENYVRISTDKSDLLFEIVDGQTLVGEGFSKGTFKKAK